MKINKFIEKIDKEIISFHKSQKTGFYTFEPYKKDFRCNLSDWGMLIAKGHYDITNYLVPLFRNDHFGKYMDIEFIYKVDGSLCSLKYFVYPDCVKRIELECSIEGGKITARLVNIYQKAY
jgi:hypothetical protein